MKNIFIILVTLSIVLLFEQNSHAAAVYLKNGKVMTGRIVEKNEEFLVLETGKGESTVRTTIFLEDIHRIETQEEYFEKLPIIPYKLYRADLKKPWDAQTFVTKSQVSSQTDTAERIKELLIEDRHIQAIETPQEELQGEEVYIEPLPRDKPLRVGDGSISGFVRLPDNLIRRRKGNLYVYIMEDAGHGQFYSGSNMLYQRIGQDEISFWQVPYKIEHVPEGTYKIFAQWDIAPPAIKEKVEEKSRTLVYLGAQGDYSGSSDAMTLQENEYRENINFKCTTLIEANEFAFVLEKKPDFWIKDLYYRRLPAEGAKIFLLVKNTSAEPIPFLAFDIVINDRKAFPLPLDIEGLEPDEEKEIDITPAYESYLGLVAEEGAEEELERKVYRFKIIWPATGEVEIEKTIQII